LHRSAPSLARLSPRGWQRDLRQQLYSDSIKTADALINGTIPKLYRYIMADDAPDQLKEDALSASVVDDVENLRRVIADVETFGSRDVATAGRFLTDKSQRLLELAIDNDRTQEQMDVGLAAARHAFQGYRGAIRRSLRIADQ